MRPFTRSCFLLLVLGRLLLALPFVLETCFASRWSPPFPLHALALIPLSFVIMRLLLSLTLPPHDLVLWTDSSPAFLPTALSMALRPPFPFRQAQYAQVFPLNPAPFCTLFAGLGSTNKSSTSLLLLTDCRFVFATLFSPPSFLLSQTLWQIWQELFFLPCCNRLQWFPGHSFLPGNNSTDELARRGALLAPLQCLVVSFLISLVSTLVLSQTGGVLSHRNSLTHRFPQLPLRNLCSLVMLAVSSLVFAATGTAYF